MKVYLAICNVIEELAKVGVGKEGYNEQQRYSFRSIESVYNALAPALAKHKLCILPRVVSRETVERPTAKGGVLFYTILTIEYDFVSAEDGSKHTVIMIGEAMDSGDKATNKAASAAFKYAALQAFCIPTEGMADADQENPELIPVKDLTSYIFMVSHCATEQELKEVWDGMAKEFRDSGDVASYNIVKTAVSGRLKQLRPDDNSPV